MTSPATATAPPILELRRVAKAYGLPARPFIAVSDISFTIREGEFVCLLGPSGCGKSTLLRIVTGLNQASSGDVLYAGAPLTGVNPHATIVFQTFALFPWLTVRENVEIALKARGVPAAERASRAERLIDSVGLDGFESAYPRELSGGMRQKVGFARAMAVEPELLCLDEPFSALDVLSAEALRGELLELWQAHAIPTKAILMVTHNIEEAVLLADRIIVMGTDPGHIVTEIPVTLRHPRHRKDTAFQALTDKVYEAVAGKTRPEAEQLAAYVPAHRLPNARPIAIAGMVEKLQQEGGRADLHRFAGDLSMSLNHFFPIVEAGVLAGVVTVHEGDLFMTPLGDSYASASILARKEIIGGRALRIPTIRWIYETLQADEDQRIDKEFFLEKLRNEFAGDADQQLDAAIAWGRFAELFAYDRETGELFLES